jgi:hypothetical protein
MADTADRPRKRSRKRAGAAAKQDEGFLRRWTDKRSERRYVAQASLWAKLSFIGMLVAAALAGAGSYGQWLRPEALGPHKASPFLLAGAAVLLGALVLFGEGVAKPVRVGDAGVAMEKSAGEITRIAWCDITRILLSDGALTLQTSGTSIVLPLASHAQAAGDALAQARERIPRLVEDIPASDLEQAGPGGEVLPLEPPQMAGLHCRSTDRSIAFEEDARMCGRCGEVYHKDGVPSRCACCDAKLRS